MVIINKWEVFLRVALQQFVFIYLANIFLFHSLFFGRPAVSSKSMVTKIQELVSAGARSEKEIGQHLKIFVQWELYRGKQEPQKTKWRFYHSKATICSHIYIKSFVKETFSTMDLEDHLRKVELWKKTSPYDSFAYHPYTTYASEEESTRPEEDSDRESHNEGEDEQILKTSTLFINQKIKDDF